MFLAVVLMLSLLMTGCGSSTGTTESTTAQSQTQASQTTEAAKAEPDEIRIFYGTAGVKIPEGVKLDDNPFINKIAELANVKFTEVTVPEYTDFQTKFNLMISSGDVPDFVHCWFPNDVNSHGAAGAFVELSDIISNSPVLSKMYTKQMIELSKDDQEKIYALRSLGSQDPMSNVVRMDLIKEINNGEIPTTPDGWYDVFKKQKEKYPDSVPYSSAGGVWPLEIFFRAYGVDVNANGVNWQYTGGKIISGFEASMCKDAVVFHKKLYDEGLLDKTFVTNKIQDFLDRKANKKLIIAPNGLLSVIAYIKYYVTNNVEGAIIVPGAQPKVDDPRVADSNVYSPLSPVAAGATAHCAAISASTKNKEAVVRLIEVLLSDEVRVLSSWGREGIEYTVGNGQKKLTDKAPETAYRIIYGTILQQGNEEQMKAGLEEKLQAVDPSIREEYAASFNKGIKTAFDQAAKVPLNPINYITLSLDTVTRLKEANELSKSIVVKAIIGEISMEEYDAQVSDYIKKYQFITDEYNSKLEATKAKLK